MSGQASLSRYERAQLLTNSVVARNDFTATDEQYFANCGKLVRLRPPLKGEATALENSCAALRMGVFVIVQRPSPAYASRPVAAITMDEDHAMRLPTELARMSDDMILDLVKKPSVRWFPI
ncbi:hypothetical protein [Rhizobium sp. RAF56]|uniref:hypothetical protein n=1 Tax=Rhizobium sp. RAF56 TaxID=3233062 RepID=UPI003F9766DE